MSIITGFNSVKIIRKQRFDLSGISSLTVSNYGGDDLLVTIGVVTRRVPAFDPALNAPYVFDIPGDGTLSEISITIDFDSVTKTGEAILDYRKSTIC